MIRSMTGYGKSHYIDEEINLDVEVKTINSRYLDINIRMPNQLNYIEDKIKKLVKANISRGRVDIFIRSLKKNICKSRIELDLDAAMDMKKKLDQLCMCLEISSGPDLKDILKNDDILTFKSDDFDEDILERKLLETIEKAIEKLDSMRLLEGKSLKEDLKSNFDLLNMTVLSIEKESLSLVEEQKIRLRQNILKIIDKGISIDEDKLANEIAFIADKADINEEITRLKSHINQFTQSLSSKNSIGKKLDFISQEMLREMNTIGSKSIKIDISKNVIEGKSIIEKIKEQVQNVE